MASTKREWRRGLKSLVGFITDPSDLRNSFDAFLLLAGPTIQREFQRFAEHPEGRRMLDATPRPDLNATLTDFDLLRSMPDDSFARAYLDYMSGEEIGSAAYFMESAQLPDKAARLGWSDEQLWFVKRMTNSHDLFHVLTGYDREITGEVGVISYTAGHLPLLPVRLLLLYFALLKPSRPFEWGRFVVNSFRHGAEAPPLTCVDYESMLPLPLKQAQRLLGVRPAAQVHSYGIPAKGWLLQAFEDRVQLV